MSKRVKNKPFCCGWLVMENALLRAVMVAQLGIVGSLKYAGGCVL